MFGDDPYALDVDEGHPFGVVLEVLKVGARARRRLWPSDHWLVLVPASTITVQRDRPLGMACPGLVGTTVEYGAHLDVITPHGRVVMSSLSHDDLLADDWVWSAGDAAEVELPPAPKA